MGWGGLGGGVQADRVKGLLSDRKGLDVEPFGGVDIYGSGIGSTQALDLFFSANQKPMFEKWRSKP